MSNTGGDSIRIFAFEMETPYPLKRTRAAKKKRKSPKTFS